MKTIEELNNLVNTEILKRSADFRKLNPTGLYLPVEYSLKVGGKRLRPVMLMVGYNLFSDDILKALPAAIAIEVFHNFTLLHDDIMDNAEVRRNLPTVHKRFGDNAAILSGDAMAFLSYQLLFECQSVKLLETLELFTKTAIEVCEGQQMDMDFEKRTLVSEAEYLKMIQLKTAVLLACGLKAGALLANAPADTANQLYGFGLNLGLAFQLQDDLLDTFGTQHSFGKKIGGDILSNKKTFLLIKALETSTPEVKSELMDWMEKPEDAGDDKIQAITAIFNQLGIKELAQQKIDFYFREASSIYDQIQLPDDRKQSLIAISNNMLHRRK